MRNDIIFEFILIMKNLIFVILSAMLTHFLPLENANAQWEQGNGIYGGSVNEIAVNGNYIFAGTNYNGVYFSTNNGINWTQTALNNKHVGSLAISGNNIFAGTWYLGGVISGGVFLSTNNGINWTQTTLNNQNIISLAVSGNDVYAGTSDSGVFRSTDSGTSWTKTALNNKRIRAILVHGYNIYAGTEDDYGMYVSTNNGVSWMQTAINIPGVFSFATIGENIFAGTYYNGVYLSTNNGTTWTNKNQGFNVVPVVNALLIANNYIFAGTDGYSVWKRSLAEITSTENISSEVPVSYSLGQNYPNPFNPTTKIRFDVANGFPIKTFGNDPPRRVVLKVYDVMGRELQTLVNESLKPGTYEVSFDGSALNSGVYFYKLITNGYTETRKMLLLK